MNELQIPETSAIEYDQIEIVVADILRQIEHQKFIDNMPPTPNKAVPTLIGNLRHLLNYEPEDDHLALLYRQAQIMDAAFRRLLQDADAVYEAAGRSECNPMMYAAAFKAQEQFCKTIKTIKSLEERSEIARIKQIRKKQNENKGKRMKARKKPNPRVKRTDNSPLLSA